MTLTERLILANQYEILEHLDADQAKYYIHLKDALTSGYELEYGRLTSAFEDPGMTIDECREVSDILEMHRTLVFSHRELKDNAAGIDPDDVQFGGFDGNEETRQFGYYRFIKDENKYGELTPPDGGNSHHPTLGRYRRMLRAFRDVRNPGRGLSADEIKAVIAAGKRP